MESKNPLVQVQELKSKRGDFTLEISDWKLMPGQVVGLVGPNGAGKSTLMELLAGLRPAKPDQVKLFGLSPERNPVEVRTRLGFMSDDAPLFSLHIGKLLKLLSGYYPSWDPELVDQMLERFRLDPTRHVDRLSKGERTRVQLVCALAFRPQLLLLDEPASGLDLHGRLELLKTVLEIVRSPERSVIVSSHLLADVQRISDRLLVIDKGSVVRDGPTDDLVGEDRTLEEALVAWGAV